MIGGWLMNKRVKLRKKIKDDIIHVDPICWPWITIANRCSAFLVQTHNTTDLLQTFYRLETLPDANQHGLVRKWLIPIYFYYLIKTNTVIPKQLLVSQQCKYNWRRYLQIINNFIMTDLWQEAICIFGTVDICMYYYYVITLTHYITSSLSLLTFKQRLKCNSITVT